MEMMKIQWKMRRNELLWMGGGLLAVYLFGTGLFTIVTWSDDTAKAAVPLGTILAIFAVLIGHLIGGVYNMVHSFGLAVSMGTTRKRFVLSYAAFSLLELLMVYIAVRLLFLLECEIYYRTMGLLTYEGAQEFVKGSFGIAFFVLAGLLVLELFCSALVLKYGTKTYGVMWLIFMLICYLPGILRRKGILSENSGLMHWIQSETDRQLTLPAILALFVLVLGVMLFAAWGIFRKQKVNI